MPTPLDIAQDTLHVDAVYTWVDGADPLWLEQKHLLGQKLSGDFSAPEKGNDAARFRDNDELRYSLRSLERFAPWVRRVHLITADQKPEWLNIERVNLVSHRDIFPADVPLPVFSTRPIEFCVHRIPGLSEHFIYCNDDFLLGRPLAKNNFFLPDGRPRLWVVKRSKTYMQQLLSRLDSSASHASSVARSHALIKERYGLSFPFTLRHYPKAMRCSSAAALWEAFPEEITATLNSPFRSPQDLSVTMLYPLFLLAEKTGVSHSINGIRQICDIIACKGMAHMGASIGDSNARNKMRAIRLLRPKTFCLNDAPGASNADRQALKDFLAAMFPRPSKYELPEA